MIFDKHYSDFALGKSTVEKWFAKFKWGEMSTEDNARSGDAQRGSYRRKTLKSTQNDFEYKVKLIGIAETLKKLNQWVEHIVHKYTKNIELIILNSIWSCSTIKKRIYASICDNRWNMSPSFHIRIKTIIIWMDCTWWTYSKVYKGASIPHTSNFLITFSNIRVLNSNINVVHQHL